MKLFEITDSERHQDALEKTGFWGKAGAGCMIMAEDTKRFLMPLRSGQVEQPGTWGTWGGAIDKGKTPEQAVRQEVREEAGYAGHFELYPLYIFEDDESGFKYYNFLAVVDEEFAPRLNWETSDYEWVEFGDWPQPLHFGVQGILNDPKSLAILKKKAQK